MLRSKKLPAVCRSLVFCFLLFGSGQLSGQEEPNPGNRINDLLSKTIAYFGPDEVLENGRIYSPSHPRAEGNPFLNDGEWKHGSLLIQGDYYPDIKLNYDVTMDQVILKKEIENQESHFPIILNSNFIESFELENRHFINLDKAEINNALNGYAELIHEGRFLFFTKHRKEFLNQYSQSNPNGFYSKLSSVHYIYDQGKLTRMGSKKAFLDYFDPLRKKLKKYMRQEKIRYKKAHHQQLSDLMRYTDEISGN